jgi:hypothetical protein
MSKGLFDDGPLRISEETNLIPLEGRTVVITNCHHAVRHRRCRKVTVIDETTTTRGTSERMVCIIDISSHELHLALRLSVMTKKRVDDGCSGRSRQQPPTPSYKLPDWLTNSHAQDDVQRNGGSEE